MRYDHRDMAARDDELPFLGKSLKQRAADKVIASKLEFFLF